MKKIKLLLVFLFVVVLVSGCTTKKETVTPSGEPTEVDNDPTLVKINNLEFHLNKEKTFDDIKYTIAEEFKEVKMDQYVQYNYLQENENGKNLLYFRVFHYKNMTKEQARNDLGLESSFTFEKGKTDSFEYNLIDTKRTDGTIHFYFIDKGTDVYVLHFVSQYDIKDFESKVLKTIKF